MRGGGGEQCGRRRVSFLHQARTSEGQVDNLVRRRSVTKGSGGLEEKGPGVLYER